LTGKKPFASSSKVGLGSVTPPLYTDDEDERNRVKEESPSPGLSDRTAPQRVITVRPPPDLAFEDYLFRSRRKPTRDLSPQQPGGWQAWSWSQLKAPVWVVASYSDGADEDDDHRANDGTESSQRPHPLDGVDAAAHSNTATTSKSSTTATLSLLKDNPS
jgi:hypothetical protein